MRRVIVSWAHNGETEIQPGTGSRQIDGQN